jgi:hypothetical protein
VENPWGLEQAQLNKFILCGIEIINSIILFEGGLIPKNPELAGGLWGGSIFTPIMAG